MSQPKSDSPPPGDEAAKWLEFYQELRTDRDQLRNDLIKMREDYFYLYFGMGLPGYQCPYSVEELHSRLNADGNRGLHEATALLWKLFAIFAGS